MKKLICLLLAALLLTVCALRPQPGEASPASTDAEKPTSPETTTREPDPATLGPGLYELCRYTADSGFRPVALAALGNRAVVLLCPVPADPAGLTYSIQTFDLDAGTAGPILPLEGSEQETGYRLSLEEDGSLVFYDPYEATAARYDAQGGLLGRVDNPYLAKYDPRFPHELANDLFTWQGSVAWQHSYSEGEYLWTAYAFPDEPEALYLLDGGYDAVRDTEGRRLLESSSLRNNGGLAYRVLDLEAGLELDRITVENDAQGEARERTFYNEGDAVLCEAGVVLRVDRDAYAPGVEYGEGGPEPDWEGRIYLWRLDETAARQVEVRRVTEDQLRAENDRLAERLSARYELNILLDEAPEGDSPPLLAGDDPALYRDAALVTGVEALPAYELLTQLEHFLALLPEGFTHEMQTDYPPLRTEYGLSGFEGFDVYVIKEIPGSSTAYANGGGQRLKLVLATDEFSSSTLPHEFMHLLERRVAAFYDSLGESAWESWQALNPAGFDYFAPEDQSALICDYFVSGYAMTNTEEDQAETFMYLFVAQDPLEDCAWYRDAPHIQAKVAWLREAIRRSYPSVQAVETAWWEGK